MHIGIFITGTDTGVGKTFVSVGLLKALKEMGHNVCPMKPVETGCGTLNGKLVPADALKKLSAAMDANQADIAYCGWQNVGIGSPGTKPYIPPDYSQMDTVAEFLRSCPWPLHAALVRREAIDAVGGFSERCFSAMDYDLWVRLAKVSRLQYLPRLWANFRLHGTGKSVARDDRCYPEMLRVYQREGGGKLSWLALRWYVRRLAYAWLPLKLRIWLRKVTN